MYPKNFDLIMEALRIMFPDEANNSIEESKELFSKKFPEEYKTWSREMIGGNNGAHEITNDEYIKQR